MSDRWRRACASRPDGTGRCTDELELETLLVERQSIALRRRGKPALWADREALDRDDPRRLGDARFKLGHRLEAGLLGADEAQHDRPVVRHVPQRFERAGPRIVVL